MNGEQLVEVLKEFEIRVGGATETQWKTKKEISPTILKNALRKFENQKLSSAVAPVVEFHKLNFDHGHNVDTLRRRIDDEVVIENLKRTPGIYAFYETQGRLVYVGKTEKNNLFQEMTQRYAGKKVPFRVLKGGKAKQENASIKDVATYFSAYKVHDHLISNVEALLTRIIINNASNLRVESFKGVGSR